MLYLIKSSNYLKIGYAKDVDTRMKAYDTHNPDYKVLDTSEGSVKDEELLHTLCLKWQFKTEWFFYNEEIINIWNRYKKNKVLSKIPNDIDEKYIKVLKEMNSMDEDFRRCLASADKHIIKGADNYFYYKY